MKALVLAAGYATRLKPLTEQVAKPLLPLAGKPVLDYVCDRIDEVAEVDEIHVVTNARFAGSFREWASGRDSRAPLLVHDDGTLSNEDRLGAIGDIVFAVEQGGLEGESLLVVAGDNVFDFSLVELVGFWRSKGRATCLAVHRLAERERLSDFGVVELDREGRVVGFEEKPKRPTSDLIATAAYVFHSDHLALIDRYSDEGNSLDEPGKFLAWLHRSEPVYGLVFEGLWLDIGDERQLLAADELMRERFGLPRRESYSL